MRIARLVTIATALGTLLPAYSMAADRLPFPDGRYVTDESLCALTGAQMVDKHMDMIGKYVRNIKGQNIDDNYELGCTISTVQQQGSDVAFKATCETDGESEAVTGRYIAIAKDAFALRGAVFRRCTTTPSEDGEVMSEDELDPDLVTGSFPLASCSGWNGSNIGFSGVDTAKAEMIGIITTADLRDYCERDPGGETTQFGGKMTVDECVGKYIKETKGVEHRAVANCQTGKLVFEAPGDRQETKFPLALDADTSCASGMPPMIAQFKAMCPTAAKKINLE